MLPLEFFSLDLSITQQEKNTSRVKYPPLNLSLNKWKRNIIQYPEKSIFPCNGLFKTLYQYIYRLRIAKACCTQHKFVNSGLRNIIHGLQANIIFPNQPCAINNTKSEVFLPSYSWPSKAFREKRNYIKQYLHTDT